MNEQTQQLIEKLAEKLGTTAEHLWGVLVRQATITSTTEAVAMFMWAVVVVWGYRLVSKKTVEDGDWNDGCGSAAFPWIIWAAATIALCISFCCSVSGIVAGFFNPEYWALKEILGR